MEWEKVEKEKEERDKEWDETRLYFSCTVCAKST